MKAGIIIIFLFVFSCSAMAKTGEKPCLFYCRGQMDVGLGFSGGRYNETNYFSGSGRFGYFFFNGVEFGGSIMYQSYPSQLIPRLFTNIFILPNSFISPLLVAELGYLFGFEHGYPNSFIASAGAGAAIHLQSNLVFTMYLIYRKYFSDIYESGITYGGGFGFYF